MYQQHGTTIDLQHAASLHTSWCILHGFDAKLHWHAFPQLEGHERALDANTLSAPDDDTEHAESIFCL